MVRLRIFVIRLRMLIAVGALIALVVTVSSPAFLQRVYPIYYYPVIRQEALKMHVDPLLVAALVRVESHFREDDVSHAGAVGLMQLMPNTASWIAAQIGQPLQHGSSGTGTSGTGTGNGTGTGQSINGEFVNGQNALSLANPQINIRLGAWYLAYLLKLFHGRLPEAVASYNAGPNRVQRWVRDGVWSGQEVTGDDIPVRETRHFLARVMYTYDIFKRYYG